LGRTKIGPSGHEFSGVIVDVGDGLNPDLISLNAVCAPLMPDFSDPQCAKGNYALGRGYNFIGSNRQGGFAEYVAMPACNAIMVDDSLDLLSEVEGLKRKIVLDCSA